MRRLAVLTTTSLLALAPSLAWAAPPGFAFLEIPTGARGAALGGAGASLVSGAEAIYWNPASLTDAHGLEVAGGHSELMQSLRHDYFAVGGQLFGGGVGASVRALYTDPIDERDELGNLVGSFGAHDLELALGYGREVGPGLSLGGTASIVRERISNLAAMTYAFGFGAAWTPSGVAGLRVALAGQNWGPSASYTIDGVKGAPVGLPGAIQTGVSYSTTVAGRLRAAAAVEGRATLGRNALGIVGTELSDQTGAAVRLGVRVNDNVSALSFGVGYALQAFSLDYAFVPLRYDLGDTHRFGFRARF